MALQEPMKGEYMQTRSRRRDPVRRALMWCVIAAAVAACGGSDSTAPSPNPTPVVCTPGNGTVCMTKSNTFDPTSMTVAVGSTVTWMNTSGTSHNVTFDTPGSPANIPSFAAGAETTTFPSRGTFAYHCTIHGARMSGTITVQ